jgi:hypothetical protein
MRQRPGPRAVLFILNKTNTGHDQSRRDFLSKKEHIILRGSELNDLGRLDLYDD